jgi:hypothetical protein
MGVVRWTTNQPPRMIRGSPSATPMHFFKENPMIVVKEEPKRMSNVDLFMIVLATLITIAILFVPFN